MRNRYNHVCRHRLNSSRRGRRNLNCASGVVRLPDGSIANLSSRSFEDALYDIVEICREYINDGFADYVEEFCNDLSNAACDVGESIADKIAKSAAEDISGYRDLIDACTSYISRIAPDANDAEYIDIKNQLDTAWKRWHTSWEYENWAEFFTDANLNSSFSNTRPIEEFVHDWFRSDTDNPNYADFENICDIVYKYARNYLTEDCFEDEAEMVRVMRRIPYDVRAMIMQKADKYLISDDIYFQ